MDVKMLFPLLLLIVFTAACGSKRNVDAVNKASNNCSDFAIPNQQIIRWKSGRFSRMDTSKSATTFSSFVEKNQSQIVYTESNYRIPRPKSMGTSLFNFKSYLNWGVDYIKATNLWNMDIKGSGTIVAIIDSGIDTTHPQLSSQLFVNSHEILNGLDDDGNGLIDDIHGFDFIRNSGSLTDDSGHGTHISGIIAANSDLGSIKGVAPKSQLLIYDFFGDEGEGDGTVYTAISAIRAAANQGAKVINASWGGANCSQALRDSIAELNNQNILFIAAAGNESENIDRFPSYPAAYDIPNLISVGAMTFDEYTAGFSNYGSNVDLVAPGVDILSTLPFPQMTGMESGTSMAAPFVTGAVALLYSAFPNASAVQIKTALIESVKKGPYPVQSRGALDVAAAYEYLQNQFSQ